MWFLLLVMRIEISNRNAKRFREFRPTYRTPADPSVFYPVNGLTV